MDTAADEFSLLGCKTILQVPNGISTKVSGHEKCGFTAKLIHFAFVFTKNTLLFYYLLTSLSVCAREPVNMANQMDGWNVGTLHFFINRTERSLQQDLPA